MLHLQLIKANPPMVTLNEPYYPIGIQDFEQLRSLNAVYVDKTDLVYKLVHTSTSVFLSRPRRFGKTLLTSTLQCYFEGRKELFDGLAMGRLEKEWTKYPVLHFDLGNVKSEDIANVKDGLSRLLRQYEAIYGRDEESLSISSRMADLITHANAQTGQKVVVLVDEYDAPILDVMHDEEKREEVRKLLREFFSSLKSCYQSLRFVFLTGISMFSQLSIFSELNNLKIISRSSEYATICGITEQELKDNFQYGIDKMAKSLGYSYDETIVRLKDAYDGYHFCEDSEGVYNPFSLLNAFCDNKLGSYWFKSGTPRFLIEMLKKFRQKRQFDISDLEPKMPFASQMFESPLEMQIGPLPLLYQAGYLTIKGYNQAADVFYLGIPNSEVRVGLLQNLLPMFSEVTAGDAITMRSVAACASAALLEGDVNQAMQLLQSLLASIPFMRGDKDILGDTEKTEAYYHRIFYFFFRMLYNEVNAEVRNSVGATDVVIKTPKYIYVVELKIDSSADTALQQIEEKGYATPYLSDPRQLVKLGVNFSTATRTLSDWTQA
jgi:hypothetical protein